VVPRKLFWGSRTETVRVWKLQILIRDFIFSPVPKANILFCLVILWHYSHSHFLSFNRIACIASEKCIQLMCFLNNIML
jgi:hypothetical protein